MNDTAGRNGDHETHDDDDGIRERPGDLKDDGSTRERRRDSGWNPDDAEGAEEDRGDGKVAPRANG